MKDAFGATYYIAFALFFITLFASMLAVAINYTKAFRVKNAIISYIEEKEGVMDEALENQIDTYVASVDYYVNNFNPGSRVTAYDEFDLSDVNCYDRGYCIYHYVPGAPMGDNNTAVEYKGDYYKVVTYVKIEFFITSILKTNLNMDFMIPVSGETRVLNPKTTT